MTLSSGIFNVILALRDVEQDPAIVDHRLAELFLKIKLILFTQDLYMIYALAPLSIVNIYLCVFPTYAILFWTHFFGVSFF